VQWWDAQGAGIETRRVSALAIEMFEERHGLILPPSFRSYMRAGSPAEDPSWDNEFTNWWPFESLKTVGQDYQQELAGPVEAYRDKLVFFADYSIWCWAWAINCAPGADYGKVAVIAGEGCDGFVSESFADFVASYIADDTTVLP
jgi:hypothetical protein